MSKTELVNKMTRAFHATKFKVKKHSPEILVVAGVVGTVASAVMACKATTKVSTILEETKETVDKIHEYVNNEEFAEQYSEQDAKKDLAIVYTQTGVKFIKLYGPSIALGALSLGCIIASHRILSKRNVALAAAYTAVDKGFKDYRSRVVERFGKAVDRKLRYNIKAKEIEELVTDEKTGEVTTVKKTVEVVDIDDPNTYSPYARFFDDGCLGWQKDSELNLYFLKCVQNQANDKLKAQKFLLLNDVYEMLGIQKTKAGFVVGWMYDEECPVGDNFVDFGIYDVHRKKSRDFVNGVERTILLDFNVDGNIVEMM